MTDNSWCPVSRLADLIGDRWSLLILRELASGPQRFKFLKENISGISMDQLSRKLESLAKGFLIVRQEFSESPPRVEYQLTEKGRSFVFVLKKMIVWSFENNWGAPALNEEVDVALTLKTMATFFGRGAGTALVRVFFSRGGEYFVVERFEDGRVTVASSENSGLPLADGIDVTLEIKMEDWLRVVKGPAAQTGGKLKVHGTVLGNQKLLNRLFPIFENVSWISSGRGLSTFEDSATVPKSDDYPNRDARQHAVDREHSV